MLTGALREIGLKNKELQTEMDDLKEKISSCTNTASHNLLEDQDTL